MHDCVQTAPVDPTHILAISADATTCTPIPMRADEQALGRALLWMDVRAADQAERIFQSGDRALHYCLT